jgi:hypothetical protein
MHPKFAVDPHHYVRAFLVLQKDLLELFDYIEPADKNLTGTTNTSQAKATGESRPPCPAHGPQFCFDMNGYRGADRSPRSTTTKARERCASSCSWIAS